MGLGVAAMLAGCSAMAVNYDEDQAGAYTLPDPLVLQNGKPVRDSRTWLEERRPQILKLYEDDIYGRSPTRPADMVFNVWDVDSHALGGKAVRKQIEVNFSGKPEGPFMHILLYTPADANGPVATFLCLQFSGNYPVIDDPGIAIFPVWDRKKDTLAMPKNPERGGSPGWKIPETLARGYGIAIIDYNDIEPDLADGTGIKYGVRALYLKPGQTEPAPDEWGAISAWAWGASRALDYLETDKDVDGRRVIMLGQSRLGKTALWAGAQDTRFALVIASCSGEMGAALSRRDYGETVTSMSRSFPYQFCRNFLSYSNRIGEMPVDSHMLISLIAPRPLYLSTGSEDRWSDPRGEFLAAVAATPVYNLFGEAGVTTNLPPRPESGGSGSILSSARLNTFAMPPLDRAILRGVGFSCHTGKHEILPADWDRFLDFADLHFRARR
jgi:(4-O-methyl)-D-glucuronate---lignin esterase